MLRRERRPHGFLVQGQRRSRRCSIRRRFSDNSRWMARRRPSLVLAGLPGVDTLPMPAFLKRKLANTVMVLGMDPDSGHGVVSYRRGKLRVRYDHRQEPAYDRIRHAIHALEEDDTRQQDLDAPDTAERASLGRRLPRPGPRSWSRRSSWRGLRQSGPVRGRRCCIACRAGSAADAVDRRVGASRRRAACAAHRLITNHPLELYLVACGAGSISVDRVFRIK